MSVITMHTRRGRTRRRVGGALVQRIGYGSLYQRLSDDNTRHTHREQPIRYNARAFSDRSEQNALNKTECARTSIHTRTCTVYQIEHHR